MPFRVPLAPHRTLVAWNERASNEFMTESLSPSLSYPLRVFTLDATEFSHLDSFVGPNLTVAKPSTVGKLCLETNGPAQTESNRELRNLVSSTDFETTFRKKKFYRVFIQRKIVIY